MPTARQPGQRHPGQRQGGSGRRLAPPALAAAPVAALLAAPALAAGPAADGAPLAPCPAAAVRQIDELYRWQLARQQQRGPIDLSSQRTRFIPALFERLEAAFRLEPADGAFVDFDVFSGTQVNTFGATVLGCAPAGEGTLEAQVAVRAGLRDRPSEAPVPLHYRLSRAAGGSWAIADIRYPGTPGFLLSTFLAELSPVGGYGFDWRQPEKARCRRISAEEASSWRSCRFEPNGSAFGLALPYHRCSRSARSEVLVYATAPACQAALEVMESHGP